MPMPPALATVLAYCSVRNERHTPPAPPPPNGPSPSMPVNIWLNIELRNMDSKSTALARALAATSGLIPDERATVSDEGVDGVGTRTCPSSELLRVASR